MMAPRMGVTDRQLARVPHVQMDGGTRGHTIAPELKEGREASCTLVAHTKGTTAFAAIQRSLDVVLEDTRGAIVGETLAKLDNGNEESGLGQRVTNVPQRLPFLFGGLYTFVAIVVMVGQSFFRAPYGADCGGLLIQRSTSNVLGLVGEIGLVQRLMQPV